jgi:hypothetical protein
LQEYTRKKLELRETDSLPLNGPAARIIFNFSILVFTGPITVTVMAPMTISEQLKDFWGTFGQFIGLFAGGFVGVFAKFLFDRRKKRQEEST